MRVTSAARRENLRVAELEEERARRVAECALGTLYLYDYISSPPVWKCMRIYPPGASLRSKIEKTSERIQAFEKGLRVTDLRLKQAQRAAAQGGSLGDLEVERKLETQKLNLELAVDELYSHVVTLEIDQDTFCRARLLPPNWKPTPQSSWESLLKIGKHVASVATGGLVSSSPYEQERKKQCEADSNCQYFIPSVWNSKWSQKVTGTSGVCGSRARMSVAMIEFEQSFASLDAAMTKYSALSAKLERNNGDLTVDERKELIWLKRELSPVVSGLQSKWAGMQELIENYAAVQLIDGEIRRRERLVAAFIRQHTGRPLRGETEEEGNLIEGSTPEENAQALSELNVKRGELVAQRQELINRVWKSFFKKGFTILGATAIIVLVASGLYLFFSWASSAAIAVSNVVGGTLSNPLFQSAVALTSLSGSGGVSSGATRSLDHISMYEQSGSRLRQNIPAANLPDRLDATALTASGINQIATEAMMTSETQLSIADWKKLIPVGAVAKGQAKIEATKQWIQITAPKRFNDMINMLRNMRTYVASLFCTAVSSPVTHLLSTFLAYFNVIPYGVAVAGGLSFFAKFLCWMVPPTQASALVSAGVIPPTPASQLPTSLEPQRVQKRQQPQQPQPSAPPEPRFLEGRQRTPKGNISRVQSPPEPEPEPEPSTPAPIPPKSKSKSKPKHIKPRLTLPTILPGPKYKYRTEIPT